MPQFHFKALGIRGNEEPKQEGEEGLLTYTRIITELEPANRRLYWAATGLLGWAAVLHENERFSKTDGQQLILALY